MRERTGRRQKRCSLILPLLRKFWQTQVSCSYVQCFHPPFGSLGVTPLFSNFICHLGFSCLHKVCEEWNVNHDNYGSWIIMMVTILHWYSASRWCCDNYRFLHVSQSPIWDCYAVAKGHPGAMHLTCSPNKGLGALSIVSVIFPEECPC